MIEDQKDDLAGDTKVLEFLNSKQQPSIFRQYPGNLDKKSLKSFKKTVQSNPKHMKTSPLSLKRIN